MYPGAPKKLLIQSPARLTIASRKSRLALWQAHFIADQIRALYPLCVVDILELSTKGDEILDRSLAKIGGKGLFIKELEYALRDGRADLAVHSMKDIPSQLSDDFQICAITQREDPYDAVLSVHYANLKALPANARVGTASLRRELHLRRHYSQLQFVTLRGNVETRLQKLLNGEYDAIVLAVAGVKRLGYTEYIQEILPESQLLPAVGQGALGIEIMQQRGDLAHWLAALNHAKSALAIFAERATAKALEANCQTPLAAFADFAIENKLSHLTLRASLAEPHSTKVISAHASALVENQETAQQLGCLVAQKIKQQQ